MTKFSIIINAGGKSSRMGADKALLDIDGKTMIERIIQQTAGLGDQIIVTNTPEDYARFGLPVASDVIPGKGALGGLYTAIHAATQPYALVLACDMPFINRPLLEHMMSLAPEFEAVVPRLTPVSQREKGDGGVSEKPPTPPPSAPSTARGTTPRSAQGASTGEGKEAEPFHAIYSKACLDPIRRAFDAGKMRVISFFPDIRLRWLEEDEIRQFDPELLAFMNCNTPEELEAVRKLWKQRIV